jgi:hypothetical protein
MRKILATTHCEAARRAAERTPERQVSVYTCGASSCSQKNGLRPPATLHVKCKRCEHRRGQDGGFRGHRVIRARKGGYPTPGVKSEFEKGKSKHRQKEDYIVPRQPLPKGFGSSWLSQDGISRFVAFFAERLEVWKITSAIWALRHVELSQVLVRLEHFSTALEAYDGNCCNQALALKTPGCGQ